MTAHASRSDQANDQDIAVMFSGGRDSSLATALFALRGQRPHLLSFQTGLGINGELRDVRIAELRSRFPSSLGPIATLPAYGIVRQIATARLEADFADFGGKNLILLGEKMALHACTIAYCLQNGITRIADGASGYQQDLPEQRPVALELFSELHDTYGVTYETPITSFRSEDEVKYALLQIGISTKSLEGTSMFADAFSYASDAVIGAYMRSKLAFVHEYIDLVTKGTISGHSELSVVTPSH